MTKYVTLKDVAEAAGVSVYSASRALNGLSGVASGTRDRVVQTAGELGYVPNRLARSLRRHDSHTIGILTANAENEFYAQLVAGLESVVGPEGFHTLASDAIELGAFSPQREAAFIESMIQLRVAGVVLTYRIRPEQLTRLLDRGIPIVFVDCTPPENASMIPFVMSDGEGISRVVGRHFADHGYRHWAFVGHTRGWPSREGREAGFSQAAQEAGARLDIVEGGNSIHDAHRAVAEYLESMGPERPDALYASNVPLLNGSVRAMKEYDLRVSADVGVIGFDEFDWAVAVETPFTIVDQGIREMGELAGELTLQSIGHELEGPPREVQEPVLRIRRSCGC